MIISVLIQIASFHYTDKALFERLPKTTYKITFSY